MLFQWGVLTQILLNNWINSQLAPIISKSRVSKNPEYWPGACWGLQSGALPAAERSLRRSRGANERAGHWGAAGSRARFAPARPGGASAASGRAGPTRCSVALFRPISSALPRSALSHPAPDGRDLLVSRGPRSGEAPGSLSQSVPRQPRPGPVFASCVGRDLYNPLPTAPWQNWVQPGSDQLCSQGTSDRKTGQS